MMTGVSWRIRAFVAAAAGIAIIRATAGDLPAVRAFEAAAFPSWARWFAAARPEHVLFARTRSGSIAGTLLLKGPARTACSRRCSARPQGPSAASASPRHCTGRARDGPGRGGSQIISQAGVRACHIGWTTRESFYWRAGYRPWRR
jgi:hypothetical protein